MFLLTNKALIWVGKGQKRKAHHHHDVGYTGELWYQGCPPRIGGPSKSEWYQVRASPTRIRVSAILGTLKKKAL